MTAHDRSVTLEPTTEHLGSDRSGEDLILPKSDTNRPHKDRIRVVIVLANSEIFGYQLTYVARVTP